MMGFTALLWESDLLGSVQRAVQKTVSVCVDDALISRQKSMRGNTLILKIAVQLRPFEKCVSIENTEQ